ncbi:MAG: hypothetical protein ABIA97_05855 [Candidatus Omnitrophota bacterium]
MNKAKKWLFIISMWIIAFVFIITTLKIIDYFSTGGTGAFFMQQ